MICPRLLTASASLLGLLSISLPVQGGVIDLPGLTSITFFEVTTLPVTEYDFATHSTELETRRANTLSSTNQDFNGVSNENYDVFYSDPDGSFNLHGDCITIEAVFPGTSGGGGLNIAAVRLNFGSTGLLANHVCSSVQHGSNAVPGSELLAVDNSVDTFSRMGNTSADADQRLRLTVSFVPEPSTLVLLGAGSIGLLGFRLPRRRSLTS